MHRCGCPALRMGPNERSPEISCRAGSAGSEVVKEPQHQATSGVSERARHRISFLLVDRCLPLPPSWRLRVCSPYRPGSKDSALVGRDNSLVLVEGWHVAHEEHAKGLQCGTGAKEAEHDLSATSAALSHKTVNVACPVHGKSAAFAARLHFSRRLSRRSRPTTGSLHSRCTALLCRCAWSCPHQYVSSGARCRHLLLGEEMDPRAK